jgi:putative copper export protein
MIGETQAFLHGAAARWLVYSSVIVLVGIAGFTLFVRNAWRARANERAPAIERRILSTGLVAACVLIGATLWRLYAQAYSIFGLDEPLTAAHIRTVAFETGWGTRWVLQFVAAVLVGLLLAPTRFRLKHQAAFVLVSAVLVVVVTPLTGHAMTREGAFGISPVLQALHVGSVGLWIGTLLVITTLLWPAGRDGFSAAIIAFSPLAFAAVSTLMLTGVLTSIVYLGPVSELWSGAYGRTLVLKVFLFSIVASVGAYNWRRSKPALTKPGALQRLRNSAWVELFLAMLTLAVTAVLVSLPLGH